MEDQSFFFEHPKFGNLRGRIINGDAKFVAADACRALGIQNYRDAISRLDDDEKDLVEIFISPTGVVLTDTQGGYQKMLVVNEPGLYRLIFSSRKKEAKEFQRWVYHEVLPAIRKNGYYSLTGETAPAVKSAPDFASLQAQLDELKAMVAQLLKSNKHSSDNRFAKSIADAVKAGKNPNRVVGQLQHARDYIALMLNEEETFAVVKVGQSKDVETRLHKIAKKYYLHVANHYNTVLLPRKVALAVESELKNILSPFKLEGEFFFCRLQDRIRDYHVVGETRRRFVKRL